MITCLVCGQELQGTNYPDIHIHIHTEKETMSAIETVMNGAMHSYEWREKTLLEQSEIFDASRAELVAKDAVIDAARSIVDWYKHGSPMTKRSAAGAKYLVPNTTAFKQLIISLERLDK